MKTKMKTTDTTRTEPRPSTKTNQEEKQKARKLFSSNMKNRRTNSQNWKRVGFDKGVSGNWLRGKKPKWRKERGNKDRAKETKRECYLQRGWWSKNQKDGILKGITEEKEKTTKHKKRRRFLKKSFWGKKEQNISRIAGHTFCVSQIVTPLEKQNCKENGAICHNVKAKTQTQEK